MAIYEDFMENIRNNDASAAIALFKNNSDLVSKIVANGNEAFKLITKYVDSSDPKFTGGFKHLYLQLLNSDAIIASLAENKKLLLEIMGNVEKNFLYMNVPGYRYRENIHPSVESCVEMLMKLLRKPEILECVSTRSLEESAPALRELITITLITTIRTELAIIKDKLRRETDFYAINFDKLIDSFQSAFSTGIEFQDLCKQIAEDVIKPKTILAGVIYQLNNHAMNGLLTQLEKFATLKNDPVFAFTLSQKLLHDIYLETPQSSTENDGIIKRLAGWVLSIKKNNPDFKLDAGLEKLMYGHSSFKKEDTKLQVIVRELESTRSHSRGNKM